MFAHGLDALNSFRASFSIFGPGKDLDVMQYTSNWNGPADKQRYQSLGPS